MSENPSPQAIPAGPLLAVGERRIINVGTHSIGVFNVDGTLYAIRNHCPHEGAELCKGRQTGTNLPTDQWGDYQWGREGMILRCPWHAWEFDLATGRAVFSEKLRVRTYRVIEYQGTLWIEPEQKP